MTKVPSLSYTLVVHTLIGKGIPIPPRADGDQTLSSGLFNCAKPTWNLSFHQEIPISFALRILTILSF